MTTATSRRRPREYRADGIAPDGGCAAWPQCVTCPWKVCVAELPASEHATFSAALRLVRSYLTAPDRTLK